MAENAHSIAMPKILPGSRSFTKQYPKACSKGVDPVIWRRAIEARLEALLDAHWRLVAALDALDGDADFEPDTDSEDTGDCEPSLGWLSLAAGGIYAGGTDDFEVDGDL